MESPTAFSVARLLATYRKTYASVATLPAALFQTRFERPLLSKRTYKCFFRARSFPLSIGMGRVTACALRGCRALSLRSPFSPAQTRAIFFHPADPPIASQTFSRDVRFAQGYPPTLGSPFHPPTHRLLCKSFTRHAPFSQVAMARRRVRRSVPTESGADQVGGAEQRQGHAVTPSLKQGLPRACPIILSIL